ncbi:MAG: hypothetical protein MJ252_25050, partial [archaeon]|nr:hypothetical protein [archaeon]
NKFKNLIPDSNQRNINEKGEIKTLTHYHKRVPSSINLSCYGNNHKKSTAYSSENNINNNNPDVKDVEPFDLVKDTNGDDLLSISKTSLKQKESPKIENEEEKDLLNLDSIIETGNINDINNDDSLEEPKEKNKEEERPINDFHKINVNNKSPSNSMRTTSAKRIPQKFSFSKQKLFELSEEKNAEHRLPNNCNSYRTMLDEIKAIKEDVQLNKNLLNKFNNCSVSSSINKKNSLIDSHELLRYSPDNLIKEEDQNEIITPREKLNFNESYSGIRIIDNNNKGFISTDLKNMFLSSKSSKLRKIDDSFKLKKITPISNSFSRAINLTYSHSSASINDTVIKISSNRNTKNEEIKEDNKPKENSHLENGLNNLIISNTSSKENEGHLETESDKENQNEFEVQYGQTVYDLDFYNNLLSAEQKNPNPNTIIYPNYIYEDIKENVLLRNHPEIENKNLLVLYDWIMQISEEFAFKRDTFHYCINYIKRYLFLSKNLKKERLQLVAITALSIAAKIEEVQIPKLSEYSNSTENAFSIEEIVDCEKEVLKLLKWKIIPITINTWLNWYICQWDLFIDTIEQNKNILLGLSEEESILFFKKSDDNSYCNFRRITELLDLITCDYHSMKFHERYIIAALIFVSLMLNYNLEYDYENKKYLGKEDDKFFTLNNLYWNFINQSFDFELYDKELMDSITYCGKMANLEFSYDLPLIFQVEENELDNVKYLFNFSLGKL